jgi:serine/threonine protein kinase
MAGPGEKAAVGGGGTERRKYPIHVEDYELYEEIGQGVSAIVYRALCKPLDEIVAVKVLDFERTNSDLVRARYTIIPYSPRIRSATLPILFFFSGCFCYVLFTACYAWCCMSLNVMAPISVLRLVTNYLDQ